MYIQKLTLMGKLCNNAVLGRLKCPRFIDVIYANFDLNLYVRCCCVSFTLHVLSDNVVMRGSIYKHVIAMV